MQNLARLRLISDTSKFDGECLRNG